MKQLMYLLLVVMMMLPIAACEEKDDIEYDRNTPATFQDVQGYWEKWWNGYKTTLIIKGNAYSVEVLNPFGEDNVVSFETGTFVMEGNVMTLTAIDGETTHETLEVWCENPQRTTLFFSPLGVFDKI